MPMPVSWVLISFSSSGEAAKSCDRHASQPACLWAGALRGPDYRHQSLLLLSKLSWDAGCRTPGVLLSFAASTPQPQVSLHRQRHESQVSAIFFCRPPRPQGDLAGRMAPPEFFHLEPCCPHLSGPAHAQFLSVLTLPEHRCFYFPFEASISFYHPGFYGPW